MVCLLPYHFTLIYLEILHSTDFNKCWGMRFVHAVPTHYNHNRNFQLKKNIQFWTQGIYHQVSYSTECLCFLYIKPRRHDKDSGLLGHNICMWLHISQIVWRNVSPSSSRVGSPGHKQYFLLWRGYGGCDAHPSILWNCRKCGVPRGCFRLGLQLHLSGSWIKQDGVCYLAFAELLWTLTPWRWRRQEPVIQQCSITFKWNRIPDYNAVNTSKLTRCDKLLNFSDPSMISAIEVLLPTNCTYPHTQRGLIQHVPAVSYSPLQGALIYKVNTRT